VPASADTLPGDTLYSFKLAGERIRLALSREDSGDALLHASFASRRASEMERAVGLGRLGALPELQERFSEHARAAFALSAEDEAVAVEVAGLLGHSADVLTALLDRLPPGGAAGVQNALDSQAAAREALIERFEERGRPLPQGLQSKIDGEHPGKGGPPESTPPGLGDEGPSGD